MSKLDISFGTDHSDEMKTDTVISDSNMFSLSEKSKVNNYIKTYDSKTCKFIYVTKQFKIYESNYIQRYQCLNFLVFV